MLKLYLYSLYNIVSIRKLPIHYSMGSELSYLAQGLKHLPKRPTFSKFLNVLDNYIDEIFDSTIAYLRLEIKLNTTSLFCDGTIFEAHNSRYKIITDTNIERSNKKYLAILNNEHSKEEMKEQALKKLALNHERAAKLALLGRQSYGRT